MLRETDLIQLRGKIDLPPLPYRNRLRGEVWAIGLVRNEADIIDRTIRHLLAQGVDHILVADNLSVDDTPAILKELAAGHPVHVAADHEPAYYQSLKMGILVGAARRSGADWIVPFDADEFWFGTRGTLAEHLRSSNTPILRAEIHNLFPTSLGSKVGDAEWAIQTSPHRQHKVAFRVHPAAVLGVGNHWVARPGTQETSLKIVHVPWRSLSQFQTKVRQGNEALEATTLNEDLGYHWRRLGSLSESEIESLWTRIVAGEAVEGIEWAPDGLAVRADPWDWSCWNPENRLV